MTESTPGGESNTQASQKPRPNHALILFVATMGGFLVTFMTSSVNIALPLIGDQFRASTVMLGWISLSYVLVAAAFLLPVGRMGDLYGHLRVFTIGMVIFTVFSFASGFAPNTAWLLALRSIHGVSLAIGAATATALVVLAFPAETRGRAIGLNVAGVYFGFTLGPVLGGAIIHNLGWRSLFWMVGALGFVNLAVCLIGLRGVDWRQPKKAPFDIVGSVNFAVALTALLVGLSLLPDVTGTILVVAGVIGSAAFLWWETKAADPLLRVDLLRRSRVFLFSNLATLINYSGNSAMIFLMSLYLEDNRRLNPQSAGFVLVTGAFVQAVSSPFAGRLADRVQARYVSSVGMGLCALGLLGLAFVGTGTAYWFIVAMLGVLGLGVGFFSSPNTHVIMGSAEGHPVGVTSAMIATMRQTGMSLSTGVATLVLGMEVGRHAIAPADYPRVLSTVRMSFLIFGALAALGIGATLVGPRR